MNLAFFGGTFDPPHKGHEMMIEHCYNTFDQLLLIPNSVSPEKSDNPPISEFHRLSMLEIIINDKNIKIDTFELKSKQPNYTYYTIEYLIQNYNFSDLYMVIGEDQLSNLFNWYKFDFILENINIVCFKRKSFFIESLKLKNIKYVSFDYHFSSSKIRGMIKNDTPFKNEKLNQEVHKYIRDNNLYK